MKKTIFLTIILSLLSITAYAKIGDVEETVYNSDILTKVHGLEIESFCIDGETLIKAEDLRDYGYTVTYDDTVRALFINKTGEIKDDFCPKVERGTVGGIYGYTYETDIWVYLNGSYVKSYALDGEMAVRIEELGGHPGFTYAYDDNQRLLTLDSVKVPSKEEQIEACLTLDESLSFLSRSLVERHSGAGFDVIVYYTGGMPRPVTNYKYFDDKGKMVDLDPIFNRYHFTDGWGRTRIEGLKLCGNVLKFKYESLLQASNDTLKGEYILDLCTHTISASPVGTIAAPVNFDIEIDGVPVQGYSVGGKPFIDSAVLENFGFYKDGVNYTRKHPDQTVAEYIESNVSYGEIKECEEMVTVNGKAYETYLMDGKLLINADDLAIKERNITPNGFSGEWDSESGTLKIRVNN